MNRLTLPGLISKEEAPRLISRLWLIPMTSATALLRRDDAPRTVCMIDGRRYYEAGALRAWLDSL